MDRSHVMAVLSRGALPNRVLLVREFDARRSHEDVPDPYYGGQSGFVEMVDMLEAAMDGLVLHVGSALEGRNHRAV
jgi:protein-tyrosine phosphatase